MESMTNKTLVHSNVYINPTLIFECLHSPNTNQKLTQQRTKRNDHNDPTPFRHWITTNREKHPWTLTFSWHCRNCVVEMSGRIVLGNVWGIFWERRDLSREIVQGGKCLVNILGEICPDHHAVLQVSMCSGYYFCQSG